MNSEVSLNYLDRYRTEGDGYNAKRIALDLGLYFLALALIMLSGAIVFSPSIEVFKLASFSVFIPGFLLFAFFFLKRIKDVSFDMVDVYVANCAKLVHGGFGKFFVTRFFMLVAFILVIAAYPFVTGEASGRVVLVCYLLVFMAIFALSTVRSWRRIPLLMDKYAANRR